MQGQVAEENVTIPAQEVQPGMRTGLFPLDMKNPVVVKTTKRFLGGWVITFSDDSVLHTDADTRLSMWRPIK